MVEKTKSEPKAKKGPGGRPTKYKPEFCTQIIEYFTNAALYDEVKLPHYKDDKVAWEDVKRFPAIFPTLVQFAKHIGISYSTVYDWQEETSDRYKPEFSKSYVRAKKMQKDFLIQAGLSGIYNAQFTVFVAKNVTDMKDKQEANLSGSINIRVVEDGDD